MRKQNLTRFKEKIHLMNTADEQREEADQEQQEKNEREHHE